MKYLLTYLLILLSLSGCLKEECFVESLSRDEVFEFRDSLGIKSSKTFRRSDLTNINSVTFIRYLSSVKVFRELNELEVKSFDGKIVYTPFLLEPNISREWITEIDKSELLKIICSKQSSLPTINRNAATLPDQLSTVGIEAMHLLNYGEGNEASYLSNYKFCPPEKQDSMVEVYRKRYGMKK